MQTPALRPPFRGLCSACLVALASCLAVAQSAPQPSAADLARYDANRNGRLDADELARQDADEKKAAAGVTEGSGGPAKEEVISLSPFEVVSDSKGYYASNTMSGTRFNTKLEDLASSTQAWVSCGWCVA